MRGSVDLLRIYIYIFY